MENYTNQDLQETLYLKEVHKGKATSAIVFGIISLLGCFGPISMCSGIIAIIMGAKAKKLSRNTVGTGGLVLGIIGTILSAPLTFFIVFEVVMMLIAFFAQLIGNIG
ncbi:MAG: hypothetical protein IJA29_09375 [Lachnospiraceae bacterium]|nr:hypothetical protein [Lachnospiraceae bacterium]